MSGHLTLLSVICQPENRTYINSLVQLVDESAVRVTEFLNPLMEQSDPSLVMRHALHLPGQRHHAAHPHDQRFAGDFLKTEIFCLLTFSLWQLAVSAVQ